MIALTYSISSAIATYTSYFITLHVIYKQTVRGRGYQPGDIIAIAAV